MKAAVRLWMVALLSLTAGCARQIVYRGTAAYEKRVATFAIQPETARRLARTHDRYAWQPSAVIDREYLFSKPYKYARLDLTGTYVDGDSGRVEKRVSSLTLRGRMLTGMPRKIPAARVSELPHSLP